MKGRFRDAALAAIGLDWDAPPYAPTSEAPDPASVVVEVDPTAAPPAPRPRPKPAEEVALYTVALVLQPINPEAHYRRGLALYHLQRWPDAAADFSAALAPQPDHGEALHWRGHAQEQLGQLQPAVADFGAAIRLAPAQAHLYRDRGRVLLRLGRTKEAVADEAESLRLWPAQPDLANTLSWLYAAGPAEVRDPARALDLAEKAVALTPGQPAYHTTLGLAQYRARREREAVASLQKSLELGGGEADALNLFLLAMCHARLGGAATARDCFDRGVRWRDAHPDLPARLAQRLQTFRAEAEAVLPRTP